MRVWVFVGCWLLVDCCFFMMIGGVCLGCLLCVVCWLFLFAYVLLIVGRWLLVCYVCLPVVAMRLLFVVCCSVCFACCVLCLACWL